MCQQNLSELNSFHNRMIAEQVTDRWVQYLFDKQSFKKRLRQFILESQQLTKGGIYEKVQVEIDNASQEIVSLLLEETVRENQKRYEIMADELSRIQNELSALKSSIVAGCDKMDLETTCYYKSKFQLSSILEQDIAYDTAEIKASIMEIHHIFDLWFGENVDQNLHISANNSSKLSQQITRICNQNCQALQRKIQKRLQTTDLVMQRRLEQVTKTLNNVLVMLNQNSRKAQSREYLQIDSVKQQSNSQSLTRQSSLQNLKLKSFFTFGHK